MTAQLYKLVEAMPDDPNSMGSEKKAQRVADVQSAIDDLERREEALVEAAQAEGFNMLRRPDASPLAVLGVVVRKPRKAAT